MLHRVEILPLRLDLGVGLQLLVALGEAEALGHGAARHLHHHHQVNALAAVLPLYAGQVKIEDIVLLLQGAQDVEQAEGEEAAVGFLEGLGQAGHGQHERNHLVLVVDHDLDQVLVDEAEVFLDEIEHLPVGQRHGAVDLLEGLVDDVEDLLDAVHDVLFLVEMQELEAAALLDPFGQAQQFLGERRHVLGHRAAEFDVVDILGKAQVFDQFLVVGKIVIAGDGRLLVEALDQHALRVQVAEAVRAGERFQAELPGPGLDRREQGGGDLGIVGGVEPAEAQVPGLVFLVGHAAVDGGDAADGLAVPPGDELAGVGVLEGRVLFLVEDLHVVGDQLWHPIGIVLVHRKRDLDERFQVFFVQDFLDSDAHGHLTRRL